MNKRKFSISLILLFIFISFFTSVLPAAAEPASVPNDPVEVGAFLDGLIDSEMNAKYIPGAVVVVVKDGEVLYAKGYGYVDLETHKPVDPARTLFRPGSVSKLLVWTSVMQLVEQGRLSLEADVNEYLDFEIPATYSEPITLKTLMSHTPGFEENDADLFKNNADGMMPLDVYLKNHIPARVFAPGTVSAYSNYGTALAGYIVERVSGMPFYEYVEKNIFEPLGMTHATLRQPLPENLAADMSGGYNYVNGDYLKTGFEYVVGYPAGGASASGLDMAKFMIAHLQNGRYGETRILKEATAIQMHSQLYTPDPRLTGMAYGFGEKFINGQRVIGHGGDTMMFHSRLFLIPEQNLGVFVSTNAVGGAEIGDALERAFVERYFPTEPPAEPVPAADFEARMAAYTGEYYLSRSNFSGFYKALRLASPTSVSVDENNRLLAMGVQFVETEPGLLVQVDQPDFKLVVKEKNGRMTITTPWPATWIKAQWYETVSLHRVHPHRRPAYVPGRDVHLDQSLLRWLVQARAAPAPAQPCTSGRRLIWIVFPGVRCHAGNADIERGPGVRRSQHELWDALLVRHDDGRTGHDSHLRVGDDAICRPRLGEAILDGRRTPLVFHPIHLGPRGNLVLTFLEPLVLTIKP